MHDLSIVIIACNEQRIIGKTLAAVASLADEIVLVDSGSTDNTVEIARQYNVQCHYQKWQGYAAQKNYAISLATKKWILSLDADEVVSDELAKEIIAACQDNSSEYIGYRIPRLLYIGNKLLKHGGFYPDAQLRLFLNGKGNFIERKVHESIRVDGPVGRLNSPLLHYAYDNFADYANTLDHYAQLSAEEFATTKQCRVNYWQTSKSNEILHPVWTFAYRYFLRGGFLDGLAGLKANWIYKDYVRKKITYLRQIIHCQNKD